MFKYVRYTPMTDEHTTHVFNEKDDKCKVHRFDVPHVSVECQKEEDFTELMAYQNPLITAVEIDKIEFEDLVQHSDQVKRMYAVVNEQYSRELQPISAKYSKEERETWPSQTAEANAVKDGTATDTPYLSALAHDEGITLEQAADRILANKAEYDQHSSESLTRKWNTLTELKEEVGL